MSDVRYWCIEDRINYLLKNCSLRNKLKAICAFVIEKGVENHFCLFIPPSKYLNKTSFKYNPIIAHAIC